MSFPLPSDEEIVNGLDDLIRDLESPQREKMISYGDVCIQAVEHPQIECLLIATEEFIEVERSLSEDDFYKFAGEDEDGPFIRAGRLRIRPNSNLGRYN